jgi:hypothetical protein
MHAHSSTIYNLLSTDISFAALQRAQRLACAKLASAQGPRSLPACCAQSYIRLHHLAEPSRQRGRQTWAACTDPLACSHLLCHPAIVQKESSLLHCLTKATQSSHQSVGLKSSTGCCAGAQILCSCMPCSQWLCLCPAAGQLLN